MGINDGRIADAVAGYGAGFSRSLNYGSEQYFFQNHDHETKAVQSSVISIYFFNCSRVDIVNIEGYLLYKQMMHARSLHAADHRVLDDALKPSTRAVQTHLFQHSLRDYLFLGLVAT